MSYLVHRNRGNWWPTVFSNRMVDDYFWPTSQTGSESVLHAPVDIIENDESYSLSVDLPGVKKEDIALSVKNNVLTISGERKSEGTEQEGRCSCSERRFGSFSRSFSLGKKIDSSAIEASLSDGVLTLTLPKLPEVQPKQIEIN